MVSHGAYLTDATSAALWLRDRASVFRPTGVWAGRSESVSNATLAGKHSNIARSAAVIVHTRISKCAVYRYIKLDISDVQPAKTYCLYVAARTLSRMEACTWKCQGSEPAGFIPTPTMTMTTRKRRRLLTATCSSRATRSWQLSAARTPFSPPRTPLAQPGTPLAPLFAMARSQTKPTPEGVEVCPRGCGRILEQKPYATANKSGPLLQE